MSKNRLTDEEKEMIVKCIEEETEIPNDLILKLNPNFFDKIKSQSNFDFKTLDKFKIPTIEYEGKRSESVNKWGRFQFVLECPKPHNPFT